MSNLNVQYLGVCDCKNGSRQLIWVGSVFSMESCEMHSRDFNSRQEAEAWVVSQELPFEHLGEYLDLHLSQACAIEIAFSMRWKTIDAFTLRVPSNNVDDRAAELAFNLQGLNFRQELQAHYSRQLGL